MNQNPIHLYPKHYFMSLLVMKFLVMEDYGGEEAAPSTPWLWVKWWLNDEWWLNEWHIMVQHMVWRHPTLMLWWLNVFFLLISVEIHVSSLATFFVTFWLHKISKHPKLGAIVVPWLAGKITRWGILQQSMFDLSDFAGEFLTQMCKMIL